MATFVWIYICKRFCSCKLFACCSFEENKLDSCSAIRRVPGHLAFLGCSGSLKIVFQRCLFCDSGSYIIYWFLFTLHLENVLSLSRRFRFIIYLNCSLFCDSASSYIYNTLPPIAIPFYHISETRALIWRSRFITYLKHGPSFAIPVHHVSTTRPLICRFRTSSILNTQPRWAIT